MDKNFCHVGNDLLQDPIHDKISGYHVLTNKWLIVGTIKKAPLRWIHTLLSALKLQGFTGSLLWMRGQCSIFHS